MATQPEFMFEALDGTARKYAHYETWKNYSFPIRILDGAAPYLDDDVPAIRFRLSGIESCPDRRGTPTAGSAASIWFDGLVGEAVGKACMLHSIPR